MIVNRSAPPGSIVPSLIYNDVGKAVDWLCHMFGFTERLRITGNDGKVGHAQLAIGMGGVLLGAPRKGQGFANSPDSADLRPPRPGEVSQTLSVHVGDVDLHYQRAKERGARILSPPVTCPFGERQYTAEDLDGYRWTFSQTVSQSWGATVKDIRGPLELLPRPRLCYLHIPALDVNRSAEFYEKVFGWNIRQRETGRPSFDDATGYVSGAFVTEKEISRTPGLLPYVWVDDLEETAGRVPAHGGELVDAPHAIGEHEWIASIRDPAGNLIGLYREGPR